MELEDLPDEMQDAFEGLKHGSSTIQSDIEDALENAKSLEEFESTVELRMQELIDEAKGTASVFSTKPMLSVLIIKLDDILTSEILEKLEDEIKVLLGSKGIRAVIENDGTGNTTVVRG